MRKYRRLTVLLLCAALFLADIVPVSASTVITTKTSTTKIYTSKETYTLPMWHYSGNYWIIGSGKSTDKVTDKYLEANDGFVEYLKSNYGRITFTIDLPEAVISARDAGDKIEVSYASRGNAALDQFFNKSSIEVITDISDGKSYFEFSIEPKYNLVSNRDFTDFADGLTKSIPLISYRYGQNVYSIFGNSVKAVQANGWYDEASSSTITVPYMHPSFILDKSGRLDGGYVISLGGKTVSTKGYTVGDGTFSNAGACGINFIFPINVTFSKTTVTQIVTEVPDEQAEDPGSDQGEVNTGTVPQPHIVPEPVIEPESDLDVTDIHAVLSLPEEAYEGQTVTAGDNSTFDFNGSYYSASSAYSKGIASNSFDYPGASRISKTKTSVDIAYSEAGTYCVTLDVNAASGEEACDARAINILPCPAVSAVIGGRQLENRKQSLTVFVQQNPRYPIKELNIKITEPVSGESITVNRNFSGAQAAPSNSAHIKYRSIFDAGSDENCIVSEVDFLSKFSETRTFRYQVSATDSRGRADSVEGVFKVEKDTPPLAKIGIAPRYYRGENSNTAVIELTDESLGSGNFERTWTCGGSNFTDLSFGTGKKVSFERIGVGSFDVKLTVKDLWTDETLEEYVTDADHLSATASASSVVDNIAPAVSLEMRSAARKEILLLASDRNTLSAIEAQLPSLKAELAGQGINADIHLDLRLSAGAAGTGDLKFVRQISSPSALIPDGTTLYYRHMDSDFWSCGHITADDSAVYSMDSGNSARTGTKNKYVIRAYPFYIKAYDSRTGTEKWSFSISETTFKSADSFENARLGHDEQGKYLYLISDGRTMLIDKSNGAFVRIIEGELGIFNFIHDSVIFSVKDDGIYLCNTAGFSKICAGQLFTGLNHVRTIGGKIRFCEIKNGAVYLSSFDPETSSVSSAPLSGTDAMCECMSIDTRGRVLIKVNAYTFKMYDSSGKLNGSAVLDESTDASVPSYDGSGRVRYVAGSYRKKTGKSDNRKYYNYMVVGDLFSSYRGSNYIMKKNDYRSFSDAASAIECGDGTVAALLPCLVVVGDSSPLYSMTEFNFSTTGGSDNCSILVSTGMPPTDYIGWFEGGTSLSMYSCVYNNIAMIVNISESEADETERLRIKWLSDPDGICIKVNGSVDAETILSAIGDTKDGDETPSRIYKVNEPIDYNIYYSDYEGDPSAASYWLYTHEPGKDGLWEKSGKVLNAPVTSFSKEGRYTLVHWQKDSAGRGLTSEFDKESNRCAMVFYVKGNGSGIPQDTGSPPEITGITTDPQTPTVGGGCETVISVTDPDGDTLSVNVEVYHSGSADPVKTWSGKATPNNGVYPGIKITDIPVPEPGTYEIVVTAGDGTSADIESAFFAPVVRNGLNANVDHTENWESNRQGFNQKNFSDPYANLFSDFSSYTAEASPRRRGKNVFWPGEKLVLRAELTGDVSSVTAQITGHDYSTVLIDAGSGIFTGTLYDSSMKTVFDTGSPLSVTVRFTAEYENSAPLTFDVPVIFDEDTGYWALHRTK